MTGPTTMESLLDTVFPLAGRRFAIARVAGGEAGADGEGRADGDLRVTLRLVGWDILPDGERAIRDIKEQRVVVVPARHLGDARLLAYIQGWRLAVMAVLETQDRLLDAGADLPDASYLGYQMPADLVHPGVLDLVRPRDPGAFARALLGSRRRLGRLLCGEDPRLPR